MRRAIGRDELLARTGDVQVVEVLPREEYEWAHLPGARNVPLKSMGGPSAVARLDPGRPVAVYCNDFL